MFQKKVLNESDIVLENWIDPSGKPWRVVIEMKTFGDRNEPVGLSITAVETGYALSQTTIRALPFAGFVRDDKAFPHQRINPNVIVGRMMAMSPTPPKREGRRYTDFELERVARIYGDAYKSHIPVQRAVADVLQIPLSTAVKQIIAARKRGLIPPHTRTKE